MFAIDDAFNGMEGFPARGNEAVPLIYLKIAKEAKRKTDGTGPGCVSFSHF